MNYQQAVDYIHGIGVFGSKLGLDRIAELLSYLGNPQRMLKIIHVAGTNGKGSTSAFVAGILQEAGYKTGLFISPYLESFNERIQINRQPIPEPRLAELVSLIKPYCDKIAASPDGHPTQFEVNTALALYYYQQEQVDFVVLEVGLGGRYDATNIVDNPIVGIITSIGFDHQAILGDTLAQIAQEKAGIIKSNMAVVTGVKQNTPLQVIRERTAACTGSLYALNQDFHSSKRTANWQGQSFEYAGINGKKVTINIPIHGIHQVDNACVALAAVEVLKEKGIDISWHDILSGISKVHWPGRMEIMQQEPLVLLDGAHNSHGTAALRESLIELHPKQFIAVIGILKDKDFSDMLADIVPLAKQVIITAPDYYRAINTEILVEEARKHCNNVTEIKPISDAIERAITAAQPDDLVLITGSLYTIGEARAYLKNRG